MIPDVLLMRIVQWKIPKVNYFLGLVAFDRRAHAWRDARVLSF